MFTHHVIFLRDLHMSRKGHPNPTRNGGSSMQKYSFLIVLNSEQFYPICALSH
jgi:hypothetical protein